MSRIEPPYSGVVGISTQFNDIPAISTTLWYSGCTLDCKGCHNTHLETFQNGMKFDVLEHEIKSRRAFTEWLVFLGGNPLDNLDSCLRVAEYSKSLNYKNFLFSGYTLLELEEKFTAKQMYQLHESFNYIKTGRYNCHLQKKDICPDYFFETVNQMVYKSNGYKFQEHYKYDITNNKPNMDYFTL